MAGNLDTELDENPSAIKQRLRSFGRSLKNIDVRRSIVAYPFAAIGIAAGVGAIVGLARPMPQRGRVSGAFIGALTAIGFRVVRTYAMQQLGTMAKNVITKGRDGEPHRRDLDARGETGVRYTPAV
jgi:hypothetical protein